MPQKRLTIPELERHLVIDQNDLQDACRGQPQMLYEVASQLALALSKRDEFKQILKEREAATDARIRHDAEVSGERVTEKSIESQKLLERDVIEAKDRVFALEKEVGALTALKEAFQARGWAIRDLIQLYMANYYGSDMEASRGDMVRANADQVRRRLAR